MTATECQAGVAQLYRAWVGIVAAGARRRQQTIACWHLKFKTAGMETGLETNIMTHTDSSVNPDAYSAEFYNGTFSNDIFWEITRWKLDTIYDIFKSGILNGKRLLDIGTGPVAYPLITASEWFEEIFLSDVSEANIEYLQKWRRGDSEHMKWLMEYFSEKAGKR